MPGVLYAYTIMSSIVKVESDTHPRKFSISHYPDELDQCFLDIFAWFQDHAEALDIKKIRGADSEDIKALKKAFSGSIPLPMITLLKSHDGGIYFEEFEGLSATAILRKSERCAKMFDDWREDWIPFAEDVDENLLVVDSKGKVRSWDTDEEIFEKDTVAKSFATFLEDYRNKLCSGRMEFIEEVGVVECTSSPVKHTGGGAASKYAD